jgi:hypothetical protein
MFGNLASLGVAGVQPPDATAVHEIAATVAHPGMLQFLERNWQAEVPTDCS